MKKILVVFFMVMLMVMPAYAGEKEDLINKMNQVFIRDEGSITNMYVDEDSDRYLRIFTHQENRNTGYVEDGIILLNKETNEIHAYADGELKNGTTIKVCAWCEYTEDLLNEDNIFEGIARRGSAYSSVK